MMFQLALVFLVVVVSLIVIASRLGFFERLREWWRRQTADPESEEALGQLRGMAKSGVLNYVIGAALGGALKSVWAWRHAPAGSTEKLVWNIVLLAAIAVGLWLVIEQVDKRINRSSAALPDYSGTRTDDSIED